MSRTKPVIAALHELTAGQYADFFALLASRNKGVTREGKLYYSCRFRNIKRTVACMIWAEGAWFEPCERDWQEGQCYKIRGLYSEHEKYGPQIEIHNIRPVNDEDRANGFDPALLVSSSRFNTEELFAQLIGIVETEIQDEPLRRLIVGLLRQHEPSIKNLPATAKQWHPFHGGWLEHVVSVTSTCLRLADHYLAQYAELQPPLNRDLIVAGSVLHDIGRVVELGENPLAPQPTVRGRLIGHPVLGRDLIRDAAREQGDVNPELIQLLEHIVLTHASLADSTPPEPALIPESLIVHYADALDSRLEMYVRCLQRDQNSAAFTSRDALLGKRLLKQRNV